MYIEAANCWVKDIDLTTWGLKDKLQGCRMFEVQRFGGLFRSNERSSCLNGWAMNVALCH